MESFGISFDVKEVREIARGQQKDTVVPQKSTDVLKSIRIYA